MADQRIDEIMGSGNWPEGPTPPVGPNKDRMQWKPSLKPLKMAPKPGQTPQNAARFNFPAPEPKPELRYMNTTDVDVLMKQIQAEEALPPHKRNQAKINRLKQQALQMMREMESQWVQQNADQLLPRLNEVQAD